MRRRELHHLLKAISGEPRLAILTHLKKVRRATVSEIADAIHRSVPTASLHLSHLERLGIVMRRRRGQEVYYRLSLGQNPIVKQVLKAL